MTVNQSLHGSLIKSPNKSEVFTEDELEEFAKCADPESGYLYFAENYSYIQHPIRGKVKFEPYEYQKRILSSFHHNRHVVAMTPRQAGKCVSKQTIVKLRNKNTGEVVETTIEEFYRKIKG